MERYLTPDCLLAITFTITAIISGAMVAWTYTEPGKRWLKAL